MVTKLTWKCVNTCPTMSPHHTTTFRVAWIFNLPLHFLEGCRGRGGIWLLGIICKVQNVSWKWVTTSMNYRPAWYFTFRTNLMTIVLSTKKLVKWTLWNHRLVVCSLLTGVIEQSSNQRNRHFYQKNRSFCVSTMKTATKFRGRLLVPPQAMLKT